MWFTRKDVQAQLLALGYDNVPENVLDSFVADLVELAQQEEAQQQRVGADIGAARDSTSVSSISSVRTYSTALTQHNIVPTQRHVSNGDRGAARIPRPARRTTAGDASDSTDTSTTESDYRQLHSHGIIDAVDQYNSVRPTWNSSSRSQRHNQQYPRAKTNSQRVLGDIDGNVRTRGMTQNYGAGANTLSQKAHSHHHSQQPRDVDEDTVVLSSEDDDEPRAALDAPSSFIRTRVPMKIVKQDPVSRGRQYREAQSKFCIPGQNRHERVRRETHERIQRDKEEPFVRPRHMHRKNAYIVPTEKKRLPLRWAVRQYTEHAQ